jgi:hypothetical protein
MSSGIPVPGVRMDGSIYFLQVGSTEFTNLLFTATDAVLPEKRGKGPRGVRSWDLNFLT